MFKNFIKKLILGQRAFGIRDRDTMKLEARLFDVVDYSKMSRKTVWQLARDGNVIDIQILLNSSEDSQKSVNQLDSKNLSPLHYATKYLHLEMIKLLINYGANVNIQGEDNMYVLYTYLYVRPFPPGPI